MFYDILDIAECVIAAAFVVFLVFTYLIHIVSVQGTSMVPTLEDGDRIIVSALGYTPENGDVVVIDGRSSYLLSEDGRIRLLTLILKPERFLLTERFRMNRI